MNISFRGADFFNINSQYNKYNKEYQTYAEVILDNNNSKDLDIFNKILDEHNEFQSKKLFGADYLELTAVNTTQKKSLKLNQVEVRDVNVLKFINDLVSKEQQKTKSLFAQKPSVKDVELLVERLNLLGVFRQVLSEFLKGTV